MAVQLSSIMLQILMLFFNWFLGYSTKSDETFVPIPVYWILYAWLPLCGIVLSLLYLARSSSGASETANRINKLSSSGGILDSRIEPDVSVTHYDEDDIPYTNMDYHEHRRNTSIEKRVKLRFSPTPEDIISSPVVYSSSNTPIYNENSPISIHGDRIQSRDTVTSKETIRFSDENSFSDTNNSSVREGSSGHFRNSSLIDLDVSLRTRPSESPHRHGLPMSFVERDSEVETVESGER